MMRVLITGGSGFIGTNLISFLASSKPSLKLINLDICPPRDITQSRFYTYCDINDYASLSAIIASFSPTHVFHLAATTGVGDLPLSYFESNISGVRNVINALSSCDSLLRVIFASSLLVCKVGYIPDSFDEYLPTTNYGVSKMKGELIVKSEAHNMDWVIVRPISIWGPWNSEPYLQFFQSVLGGYYFNIGRFKSLRSLGYVENTVFQLCRLLEAPAPLVRSKTFYLADYHPTQLRKMAKHIAQFRSFSDFIPTLPLFIVRFLSILGDFFAFAFSVKMPLTSFRLHNLLTEYVFDLSPLSKVCGPLPFDMEDGVVRTISFMKRRIPKS